MLTPTTTAHITQGDAECPASAIAHLFIVEKQEITNRISHVPYKFPWEEEWRINHIPCTADSFSTPQGLQLLRDLRQALGPLKATYNEIRDRTGKTVCFHLVLNLGVAYKSEKDSPRIERSVANDKGKTVDDALFRIIKNIWNECADTKNHVVVGCSRSKNNRRKFLVDGDDNGNVLFRPVADPRVGLMVKINKNARQSAENRLALAA